MQDNRLLRNKFLLSLEAKTRPSMHSSSPKIDNKIDQKKFLVMKPDAGLEPAALRYLFKSLTLYRLS